MSKKITIFGAGFVGFSLSVLLSAKHQVTIFDIDQEKVKKINQNLSPIDEESSVYLVLAKEPFQVIGLMKFLLE